MGRQIPNPRKEELRQALSSLKSTRDTLDDVLTTVHTAITNEAWTGGTSADFSGELETQEKRATDAGDAAVAVAQTEYNHTPAMIDAPGGGDEAV